MALRLRQPQSRVCHKLQPRTACCEGARCEQTFHPRTSNKSHPLPCSFHVGCACEPLALTSSCRDKGKPGLVTGVTCRDKMVMDTAVCAPPHRHALHPPRPLVRPATLLETRQAPTSARTASYRACYTREKFVGCEQRGGHLCVRGASLICLSTSGGDMPVRGGDSRGRSAHPPTTR